MILYAQRGDSPILGRVDWYPTISTSSFNSALINGVCGDYSSLVDGIPVTVINPADYGVQELPNEVAPGVVGLGWLPPLLPEVQQSEVIFCNGLENCPQQ